MVTSIGFGVHECSAKGTKYILLINSDRPCEQIHEHCSCSSHSCSLTKHSHKCCTTEIHHLDLDYDITQSVSGSSLSEESVSNYLLTFALNTSQIKAPSIYRNLEFKHGPPIHIETNQILAVLAQWRL